MVTIATGTLHVDHYLAGRRLPVGWQQGREVAHGREAREHVAKIHERVRAVAFA